MHTNGKSKGLNRAVRTAKGTVFCFIDDDIVVSRNWLSGIVRYYKTHPHCSVVYGSILPYQPNRHKGQIAPSCFFKREGAVHTSINTLFYTTIGNSGNMACTKEVLGRLGPWKEWLGPGVFGFTGGEDGEMMTRMLIAGIPLHYDPHILVYHNKWLSKEAYQQALITYTSGEIAYAVYYYCKGYSYFGTLLPQIFRNRLDHRLFQKAYHAFQSGRWMSGFCFLKRAMTDPIRLIFVSLKATGIALVFFFLEKRTHRV
jgi:GT2 family glycosyltransferase